MLALLLAACGITGAYPCQQDSQCLDGAAMGICQPDGWCSFPAEGCASGQQYGSHAGDGVAGMCVDDSATTGGADGPITASATGGGASDDAATDAGPTDDGADPTIGSLEDTSPLDDGDTGAASTSDDPSTTGTTSDVDPTEPASDASTSDVTDGMLPTCGNGILEPPEQCDGDDVDGQSCQSVFGDDGTLLCTDDCTFDGSMCIPLDDDAYLPCLVEDDCSATEICYLDAGNGTCLAGCDEADDCPSLAGAQLPICDMDGTCKLPCGEDAQCPKPMRCDPTPTGNFCLY